MLNFKGIIKLLINFIGYDLTKKNGVVLKKEDDEFEKIITIINKNSFLRREGFQSLYRQMIHVNQIQLSGDIVECGVWKGGSAALLAKASLLSGNNTRMIHLFDSFTDICEPNQEKDGERAVSEAKEFTGVKELQGKLIPISGFYDKFGGHGTIADCKRLICETMEYDESKVMFHQGWFQDTIPNISKLIEKISILHLDADWYESTKICLENLYEKVEQGGFVIIDDYGTYEGCKKAVDEFIYSLDRPPFLNKVDESIVYFVKG
jgi:hypothetical protein